MRGKKNLVSALGIQKKIGGYHHFSEIIKLQPGFERHTLLCILKLFTNIVHYLSLKKCVVIPNFLFRFQKPLGYVFPAYS